MPLPHNMISTNFFEPVSYTYKSIGKTWEEWVFPVQFKASFYVCFKFAIVEEIEKFAPKAFIFKYAAENGLLIPIL